jgi:glycosyltransferase involved in cell wall biosynthesis
MERAPGPAIWVDVEDIFEYFRFNPHPSGIQRVAIEITRALIEEAGGRIRIARHGSHAGSVREVRWAEVETMLATPPPPARKPAEPDQSDDFERRSRVQRSIMRLPPELRDNLFRAGVLQSQVLRNVRALVAGPSTSRELRVAPAGISAEGAGPGSGEAYVVLGAPWSVPRSAAHLEALRARGVRTALLIHDLIPVRRPEWQSRARVERFRDWLEASLRASAVVLSLSRFTAADVEAYARRHGIALAGPVRPIGAGTSTLPPACPQPGLPDCGRYVLFVSTLEARKNHALAVKVWQKLMQEVRAGTRAAETVPTLVFAGRVGLGVADLLQQMDNSRWLNGRIRLIRDPSDAELRALYDGCLFTLLPSLYEGFGLPLGESLALGQPCLAASGTALPETGGDLCRYFDPEDVGAAHRAVAGLLDEPGAIAAWQDQVRRQFRPRSWQAAAQAVLAECAGVAA